MASMAFCGNDGLMILGWDDGRVSLWDPASGNLIPLPQHPAPITAVAATGDGAWVATADEAGGVRWWNLANDGPTHQRNVADIQTLRFSPDGTLLVCAAEDGQIRILDVREGTDLGDVGDATSPVYAVEFSPDSRLLIVVRLDATQVWDVTQHREVARFNAWAYNPRAVAFDADKRQVFLLDDHETVTRWDIATGQRLETVPGRRRVARAAFSPGARVLAVGSRHSGQIRIRDIAAPNEVLTLRHLGPKATAMAFDPDGRWLAAAGEDGSVRAWRLERSADDPDWRTAVLADAARRSLPLAVCFLLGLAGCCFAAVSDWRCGLGLCFVLALLREPVRKLLFEVPVWVTVAVALVWIAVGIGFLLQDSKTVGRWWRSCPYGRWALVLSVLALLPAAVYSSISYPAGWQFVLLGGGWYGFAWLGLVLGWALPRSDRDVSRLLAVFCAVHGVGLLGCVPESLGWNLAILGGIDADWYRSFTTGVIRLVSGPYRSPDVLGWHAAHVMMFAAILLTRMPPAVERNSFRSPLGIAAVLMAALALVLAGRRKMTMMPFVFLATWGLGSLRGAKRWAALSILAAVVLAAWIPLQTLRRSERAPDVVKYLAWTASDTVGRVAANLGGAVGTWCTAGVLGHGLGTATQGRQYLRAEGPRLWQEDGLGLVLAELGAYGTLLLLAASVCLALALRSAIARDGASRWWLRIPLTSVVLANLACFAVSHQLYSGDPTVAATVGWCLGMALAPRPSSTDAAQVHPEPASSAAIAR